jgi:1-acyl-sn-glycerol-3-phosphate acyltransferase
VFYRFLWWVLKLFIGVPWRVRWLHVDHVPEGHGGVILAGNHESYVDPVLIAMGPWRHVHFMAKAELWDNPFLPPIIERMDSFPVKRGSADRGAIAEATRLLDSGEAVGIFPQGSRHHAAGAEGLREGAGGAALIAMRAGVPVVPVGIYGSDRIRPSGSRFPHFPRITVVYGDAIDPASIPEGGRRERIDAMTARIMEGIASAVAEAGGREGA